MKNYVVVSLELHLFFLRIMKEHAFFLETGFKAKDCGWIKRASFFRSQFEILLGETVELSDGVVSRDVLESGEVVTVFTLQAENETSCLTGIPINCQITERECELTPGCRCDCGVDRALAGRVRSLNQRAFRLLNELIAFKESVLREVCACKLYTANYPSLIRHMIREAKFYRLLLQELDSKGNGGRRSVLETETFWNRIMMEHALFIRGLLDPCEEALIGDANGFADVYCELLAQAENQKCNAMEELTRKTMRETERFRDFKTAGTKGICECEISSLILPLLADHDLREANYYLRILRDICRIGKA